MNTFRIRQVLIITLVGAMPLVALAAQTATPTDLKSYAKILVDILTDATIVAVGIGMLYYIKGIAGSMNPGQGSQGKGWQVMRERALWGLLALFVMFSIWGIMRVISNTLFGNDHFSVS